MVAPVVLPPPRITGNLKADLDAMNEWFTDVYQIAIVGNQFWQESGSFTISESDTTATVSFAATQDDTEYQIHEDATNVTGTPAAGSSTRASLAKTTTGFVIAMEAAPGAGNSVTFDWSLMRSIT
jgi:hypothetical protein